MDDPSSQTTAILQAVEAGDRAAVDRLVPLVYTELRALAASHLQRESPGHTLQPTALVHEAFLKLADQQRVHWQGRTHFFAVGAQIMRRILVDHARAKKTARRGAGRLRVPIEEGVTVSPRSEEDVLAVDEALERLAQIDGRQARIVELRFFGGLSVDEVAEAMGISKRTVEREWTAVRAWLRRELAEDAPP
ncbi:MAG: sigma-70 family RNA polymerase sigma factor [Pirellulales bacterium]|nr:sigma-70 family RNA polymerase sigma factor [Pirellulales bacterium]